MSPPIPTVSAPGCPKAAEPSLLQAARWSKDLILARFSSNYRGCKPSNVACKSSLQANFLSSSNICARGFLSSAGTQYNHLVALSSQFLGEEEGGLQHINHFLAKQRRSRSSPRAYKDDIFKFDYPVITKKPKWWWRTSACVPYLIALQISDTGYFVHPLAEHYEIFESLVYFVPGAIKRLPPWFSMIYCYIGYIGIVKNKDWPHFFRFHLMMAMLLETALLLIWYTSNFFPLIHYNGKFGMHFWAGIGFFYIFTLLICVRSALGGKYARIPFVSDAAYIHTLFNGRSFQKPF
ncbi:protein TIC 20-IV, chloroplastic-like isoform X2 [Herrania umbratica]|uniref:Protein TIC 20 n=1 Tax=Herrania umbratica TaxID=108875 RepID=A0A6J0ZZ17_9ROSI|nr:protein TIC 20-IV, chloroplastic-like isoform X2 [Herrania umbratica]